jgi:hypothetical protein
MDNELFISLLAGLISGATVYFFIYVGSTYFFNEEGDDR